MVKKADGDMYKQKQTKFDFWKLLWLFKFIIKLFKCSDSQCGTLAPAVSSLFS